MCIQEKLKMCKFPLNASMQKSMQNFFAKVVQSACFWYRLSKEQYNVKNPMTESRLNVDLVWYR